MLVVGLGNPGARYVDTRHNIGFRVIDLLAERLGVSWRERFSGRFASAELAGARVHLLQPLTYMNRSGQSVVAAARFYKVDPQEILTVHDELDLPFATLKLKRGGGEAGHNGLRSISQQLGSRDYLRLRVGVGKPPAEFRGSGADFLLQAFAPAERLALEDLVRDAANAVELVIDRGMDEAMNNVNRRV